MDAQHMHDACMNHVSASLFVSFITFSQFYENQTGIKENCWTYRPNIVAGMN